MQKSIDAWNMPRPKFINIPIPPVPYQTDEMNNEKITWDQIHDAKKQVFV